MIRKDVREYETSDRPAGPDQIRGSAPLWGSSTPHSLRSHYRDQVPGVVRVDSQPFGSPSGMPLVDEEIVHPSGEKRKACGRKSEKGERKATRNAPVGGVAVGFLQRLKHGAETTNRSCHSRPAVASRIKRHAHAILAATDTERSSARRLVGPASGDYSGRVLRPASSAMKRDHSFAVAVRFMWHGQSWPRRIRSGLSSEPAGRRPRSGRTRFPALVHKSNAHPRRRGSMFYASRRFRLPFVRFPLSPFRV